MDIRDLRSGLVRRWYVVLVGLLLTAAVSVVAMDRVKPTYQVSGAALLVPGEASIVEGGNPFLYLGGLVQARDVLVRALSSEELHEPIIDRYPGVEIGITADPSTSGPVIAVTAVGPTPRAARAARDEAMALVPAQLTRLQDAVNAPEQSRASVLVLMVNNQVETIARDQIRVLGGVVAAGVLGTLLTTGLVDGLLLARRSARTDSATVVHHRNADPQRDKLLLGA